MGFHGEKGGSSRKRERWKKVPDQTARGKEIRKSGKVQKKGKTYERSTLFTLNPEQKEGRPLKGEEKKATNSKRGGLKEWEGGLSQ